MMADQFYSLHPDDSGFVMNYATTLPQQQQQQPKPEQQQQSFSQQTHPTFIAAGQQNMSMNLPNETYDYINVNNNNNSNSAVTYFTTNAATTTTTASIDLNNNSINGNNNNNFHYFNDNHIFQNIMHSTTNGILSNSASFISTSDNNLPNQNVNGNIVSCQHANINIGTVPCQTRNRYMPYSRSRTCAAAAEVAANNSFTFANTYAAKNNALVPTNCATSARATTSSCTQAALNRSQLSNNVVALADANKLNQQQLGIVNTTQQQQQYATVSDPSQTITLQITNLDYSMNEASLRYILMNQLKPITPVVSLVFEGSSYAKVTVPDLYFAKQVVANLHRKKIGHKRMLVSYTRDSSLTEINTLRCQVAGLLKDVPYYTLPMYKFRELFQSRFKTSISVFDLYKMPDICIINTDNNEDKFISLQPELINSLENSPLIEGLQHSVPYCTIHFKREQHKGWAEQEIEPLPNVLITIAELEAILYPLIKNHPGDIPVASLVHCIESELKITLAANETGVNLEHLICCVQGIQIQLNNFGIKILNWHEMDKDSNYTSHSGSSLPERTSGILSKNSLSDSLYQISREVMELIKMSPKATMKFSRFIPAYHNHFGKQCRVADYGYTKLIELFEALSSVVQIMGDGENRQITLTHRTQVRRFTSDLLRVLRTHSNKSVLLSQLPVIFSQTQNRNFDITDYGVCNIVDILDGLVNSNIVIVSNVQNGEDILISMPKRKQTANELEKTSVFAGEMVELFRCAPQYTILFQKLVRSYHYHFAYQCRLSDYGFLKLADLMESIQGIVEMELSNEEDKKINLCPKVAQRVFVEQCEELIRTATGSSKTSMKLDDILIMHKKKFGYLMQPQTLGKETILEAVKSMAYIEVFERENEIWITCHSENVLFRSQCYRACKFLLAHENKDKNNSDSKQDSQEKDTTKTFTVEEFLTELEAKHKILLTESMLSAMKHAIEIRNEQGVQIVKLTKFLRFILSIVRLLEKRQTMILYDIKKMLDCNLTTTFEFGYPNLYKILTDYPDLFAVNMSLSEERSEISLIPNCELRSTKIGHHLYGSLKLPFAKQQKSARLARAPLSEQNGRNNSGPPPAKQRALAIENNQHAFVNGLNVTHTNKMPKQLDINAKLTLCEEQTKQKYIAADNSEASDTSIGILNASSSSIVISNNSNKENSFNNSMNLHNLNNSFNLSNVSFSELNTSMNNNNSYNFTLPSKILPNMLPNEGSKLWDRRLSNQYFPQTEALRSNFHFGSALPRLVIPAQTHTQPISINSQSTGLFELVNNMNMCPIYEPPKPDSPPSKDMPFWIDPIWVNNATQQPQHNALLNIKLPEMKSFNVLPMVLSPYTLSKNENMRQQSFNFDNHDRKIA